MLPSARSRRRGGGSLRDNDGRAHDLKRRRPFALRQRAHDGALQRRHFFPVDAQFRHALAAQHGDRPGKDPAVKRIPAQRIEFAPDVLPRAFPQRGVILGRTDGFGRPLPERTSSTQPRRESLLRIAVRRRRRRAAKVRPRLHDIDDAVPVAEAVGYSHREVRDSLGLEDRQFGPHHRIREGRLTTEAGSGRSQPRFDPRLSGTGLVRQARSGAVVVVGGGGESSARTSNRSPEGEDGAPRSSSFSFSSDAAPNMATRTPPSALF
mmetsp:Transcript_3648/g.9820  ORF Transcript_3648/g.9820 Transcript_3648/m.9820 type:complete len:265 (-) Transcript_3648:981-1775(-)